jgi:4-hydroxy-3-polyprenylbenzoate decarboxylase
MTRPPITRRAFVTSTTVGIAAAAATSSCAITGPVARTAALENRAAPTGPFDTMRDMLAALDARGRLLRIDRIDQDAYEGTALMYRLVEKHGLEGAPALLFDEVKIGGQWIRGPVVGNYLGHWDTECLALGLLPDPDDGPATFRKARAHLIALAAKNGGRYPEIPPVLIAPGQARCKEVVLRGDEIDLTRFPIMQVNPGDGGRYINTASVYTVDPKAGVNLGTYRCQLKGPRKVAVSPGAGQTGWNMLMAARKRGEKTAQVTLILGQDPIVYVVSGSRAAGRQGNKPVDELAVAGGLRGRAVEVVKCETNNFLVPAHVEMVIEGVIPLDDLEREGPYGEGLGYQGDGENAFWMTVTTVTHRRNPWFHNSFTGVDRGPMKSPGVASSYLFAKKFVPEIVDFHYLGNANNIFFISIDKTRPGQGIAAGEKLGKFNPVAKVVIVVDKDVDLMNLPQVMAAISSRWQPSPAARIYENLPGLPLDPSQSDPNKTSKIVIDATRQLPGEGGPASFPRTNRELLTTLAPDAFARVDAKWGDIVAGFGRGSS